MRRFFKAHWKRFLILLFLGGGIVIFHLLGWYEYLDFDYVSARRTALLAYVEVHYWVAVAVFILVYMTTAFFVPGAIVLTLVGGFLFGVLPATLYINVGASLGSVLALLLSRHILGNWIQEHYAEQLKPFNRAFEQHGASYLLVLRLVPILPFFAVNYLAGLTRIPLKTFLLITSLGMVPGSMVYTYAGRQLGSIGRLEEILSPRILAALALLGLFSLIPPLFHYLKRLRDKS